MSQEWEMTEPLNQLAGGDRRSIGRVPEVVQQVLEDPTSFPALFEGMLHGDPVVRMRAADAVEKITAAHPEFLRPFKDRLIGQVARIDQQEVRWHVAQMLPRLELDEDEKATSVTILLDYLHDKSKIVKTFAMQALADFAERDAALRPEVIQLLEELTRTGSPAMASRGRKLRQRLSQITR
jgi:HEAT repeat protein